MRCEFHFPSRQMKLTPLDSSLLPSARQVNTLRQVSLTPVMFKLTCRIESRESSSFRPCGSEAPQCALADSLDKSVSVWDSWAHWGCPCTDRSDLVQVTLILCQVNSENPIFYHAGLRSALLPRGQCAHIRALAWLEVCLCLSYLSDHKQQIH